jgi:ATP-dependent helicase Lhr and Lhr-like helicase
VREGLERHLDGPRLASALARLRRSAAIVTDAARPTPFAFPLIVEIFREKLWTEAFEVRVARMVEQLEVAAAKTEPATSP